MQERAHGVTAMGGMGGAQRDSLKRLLIRGIGMPYAARDALRDQACNHLMGTWQLRREGDDPQMAVSKRQDALGLDGIRHAEPGGQVRATPLDADIRAFQMDAQWLRLSAR